jgi:hypothetical protein
MTIKLTPISNGPGKPIRGVGVRVKFNGKSTAKLLLDTGAFGISVSPKFAGHAELEDLGAQSETHGIGDGKTQSTLPISEVEVIAISGILGMPVLRHLKLNIDYRNGALKLDYAGPRLDVRANP